MKQLVDVILPAIFDMWDTEDDRSVLVPLFALGPAPIPPILRHPMVEQHLLDPNDELINSAHYETG